MFRPRRPSTSLSSAPSTSATFSARSSTVSYPPSLPSLPLWRSPSVGRLGALHVLRSGLLHLGPLLGLPQGPCLLRRLRRRAPDARHHSCRHRRALGQYMWIDRRNYPGGPLGFFAATGNAWYNVFGSAADATANVLGDGLLVRLIYVSCENWKREF